MLQIDNFSYFYPEQQSPALSGISLDVRKGECICIVGHSGCGKSTLLLAIKRLLPAGAMTGEIRYAGKIPSAEAAFSELGLVFQNSESQLLCSTVYDEVAFGPENLCVPPPEINRRVVESLKAVDLLQFGNRNVERFSAGQKQRLCIASILSMAPAVMLLDEPTSQLDNKGKNDLCESLARLKAEGMTIIIAEHNIDPLVDLIDRYCIMERGTIIGTSSVAPGPYVSPRTPVSSGNPASTRPAGGNTVISAEGLCASYQGSGRILHDLTFSISAGELVHIFGENGCGKSTLLKVIAGAVQTESGTLHVEGRKFPKAGGLLGTVALLFQNPQRQLFEDTVYDEVAFTLKRLKLPQGEIEERVKAALVACEADHLSDRLPLTLSFGEQHRVALASVIAPDPSLLLLDEPFAGLDPAQRLRLLKILSFLRWERNTAVVIASHDPLPDADWADRIMIMEEGRLITSQWKSE